MYRLRILDIEGDAKGQACKKISIYKINVLECEEIEAKSGFANESFAA